MGAGQKKKGDPLRIQIGGIEGRQKQPLNRVTTTKYTWLTFLPLNFYEQFRRAVYFYFLIITIVSFFVNETISPYVSLIPLLFVMVITALKEGLEDLSRSKSDKLVNTARVTVIRNGKEEVINSQFIVPGDLVVVRNDGDLPCDLVLLQSSGADGKCFVTTANLDGETNLKTISVPPNYVLSPKDGLQGKDFIVCEPSTSDLYSFNGRLELGAGAGHGTGDGAGAGAGASDALPLTIENLLLRGVRVKGTDRVVGCAIYTGMHTKLQLNSRYTGNKSASSEKYINRFMVALIVGMVVVVVVLYLIERHKETKVVPTMPYLGPPTNFNSALQIFEDFLSFLLLFNYMVPISAYMNIELYRIFGMYFMHNDLKLYDEDTDQPCRVNASNLNEELGQVNILFSDKTGTLTKNLMKFVNCFVSDKDFQLQNTHLLCEATGEQFDLEKLDTEATVFFEALAVCHTVEVSERKRMSVVLRDRSGTIWLYSKGAENAIFPRCKACPLLKQADEQITKYAQKGLRTLAVARRTLTEEEFGNFEVLYRRANTQLSNRNELIRECYETVEIELDLLGATALEDALQEKVGETLEALQAAGLKIWVLTGDKVETAYNIGLACRHIPPGSKQHFIVDVTGPEELLARLQEIDAADPECADFAIARFEMLRRLLLVHGHYNSRRLAFLVLFYCYKNIIITGCMALFQLYNLFSATNVYNSLYLWLFDLVYISFSFTYLAFSDKKYSEETLLSHPELYKRIAHNRQASMGVFCLWILNGFVQCFTIFYFTYAVLNDQNVLFNMGQPASFQTFGTMLITVIVIVGNLKLLLVARYMSYLNLALIFASIAAFMLTTYLYNLVQSGELYDVYNQFLASLPLWLFTIVCSAACLLPDLVVRVAKEVFRKTPPAGKSAA
uniref:Probable phospholipid-transporting ATPase IF n=1 Tax=Drosophila rhopaloa TaxID=1041015 RepID=A0A6P4ELC5_DRORH